MGRLTGNRSVGPKEGMLIVCVCVRRFATILVSLFYVFLCLLLRAKSMLPRMLGTRPGCSESKKKNIPYKYIFYSPPNLSLSLTISNKYVA